DEIIGELHPIPAVIPVHGEIAADDGSGATDAHFREDGIRFSQGGFGATGRRVPPVQERVQEDALGTALGRYPDRLEQMLFMAVYAAGGEQAENMYRLVLAHRAVDGVGNDRIGREGAILHVF